MNCVLDHTPEELAGAFREQGIEPFRAAQVARWIFARGTRDFDAMTDLSLELRRRLADGWRTRSLALEHVHDSGDGTRKLELRTQDGARIEAVLIPEGRRRTLCVSSQVGCSLDCTFCATALLGFGRNLAAAEIIDQVLHGAELLAPLGERPTHVVFMGMGEPLLNLANVVRAIRILTHADGVGLSPRRITVSTAGVVPRMAELGRSVDVRLAVSLHATTDEVRDRLVPLNRRFPIATLIEACASYPVARRDRISLEYTLIRDLNDTAGDARRLAELARPLPAKVNLIPLNELPGSPWRRPDDTRVRDFAERLAKAGVTATVRRSRGEDIFAACGQLGALGAARQTASSLSSGR